MKKNGFFVLGTAALVFALALSGCGTLGSLLGGSEQEVQTEVSQKLMDGANDIIGAKEAGIIRESFEAPFARKFPGVEWDRLSSPSDLSDYLRKYKAECTYQGKKYRMTFTVLDSSSSSAHYLTSVTKCVELQKTEKEAAK